MNRRFAISVYSHQERIGVCENRMRRPQSTGRDSCLTTSDACPEPCTQREKNIALESGDGCIFVGRLGTKMEIPE